MKEVAAFGVGQTFGKKMPRQHRETGDLSPRPRGGGQPPRLSDKHLKPLRREVERSPDQTAAALRDHLEERAPSLRQPPDRHPRAFAARAVA